MDNLLSQKICRRFGEREGPLGSANQMANGKWLCVWRCFWAEPLEEVFSRDKLKSGLIDKLQLRRVVSLSAAALPGLSGGGELALDGGTSSVAEIRSHELEVGSIWAIICEEQLLFLKGVPPDMYPVKGGPGA